MTVRRVIMLGDANVDLVIQLPRHERTDGPLVSALPAIFGGGTVANAAVALARLGVPVAFMGLVGDDGYGRFVRADLESEGVDTATLGVHSDAFTPMVIAFIDRHGERTLSVWPTSGAAYTRLAPDDIDRDAITGAMWLHTSGMCLGEAPTRNAVIHAMRLARAAGVPVSLDLNLRLELRAWEDPLRAAVEAAIPLADIVFGSAREELIPITGAATVEDAARMVGGGMRTVVARLGANGALIVSPDEVCHVPGFPVAVVDTLGAGDAFDGGFIAARVAGLSLSDAGRWGNAAAALNITRSGARGMPSRDEVERLLAAPQNAPDTH